MLAEINVTNIYVITNGSLLQVIFIFLHRVNSPHYMSYNTDLNNISIGNYKREILPTHLVELHVYATFLLSWVYVEAIYNIKGYISTRNTQFNGRWIPRNIANKYFSIFGKALQCWSLMYIWIIQSTRYVRFSNIYSTTTWSTLLYVEDTYARLVYTWYKSVFHTIAVLIVFFAVIREKGIWWKQYQNDTAERQRRDSVTISNKISR